MFERMRIGFHFFTVAAMAAFSMVSLTACGDDAGSNPNPLEMQKKCRREGLNELCLVVSDKGKIEYFHSYMDITDALEERMSNDFAGTDISVYTSVDSAGNAWVEKQCNAENEGSVLEFRYYPYKFSYELYFKCSANKWKIVSDEDVHCPATAEIGDICDGETFVHGFGGSITPIYIYTSSGWTWFDSSSMGNFCRAVVVPLNQYGDSRTPFATLVLDSDTDHPKYQFARFDTDSLEKYMSGYCDVKWDWSGCDIENGEVCVERSRIYIKSNGECDEDKTIMTESVRGTYYNQLANMYITETCDAANNGKLATVVDSIVFPNGQVLKQELQYQCDSDLKRWNLMDQNAETPTDSAAAAD